MLAGHARASLAAVAGLFLATCQSSAGGLALNERTGSVHGWAVGYSEAVKGCAASATFSDQTTVWLGISGNGNDYYFALTNPNWQSIEAGKRYEIRISAIGGGRWRGTFYGLARDNEKGIYAQHLKPNFVSDVVRTAGFAVNLGDRTVAKLSLDGSPDAMAAIADCLKTRVAAAPTPQSEDHSDRSGTGFFISDQGHILTNHHVINRCGTLKVQRPGGQFYEARVLASDAQNDLGVITTSMPPTAVAALRTDLKLGENVYVFGFPLSDLLSSSGNFTVGYVSALSGLRDDSSRMQISAQVQPGNSGGPVLDKSGNVIGVVVSMLNAVKMVEAAGLVPQNVNFAIKARSAVNFLDANSVRLKGVTKTDQLESAEIAERARAFTVKILCTSK